MNSFFARARTSLLKIVVIYVSAAYVLLQAASLFRDQLSLPAWVFTVPLIVTAVGLPIVVFAALLHEWRREPHHGTSPLTGKRLRRTGAALAALLVFFVAAIPLARNVGIGPLATLAARHEFNADKEVILADFENHTSDRNMGLAVTDALRTDLAQSRFLTLVTRERTVQVLARMERPDTAVVTRNTAREVAQREGLDAVIAGSISALGNGYVLTVELVTADSGRVLYSDREEARDNNEVIKAVDKLSRKLRERLGDSLKQIRKGVRLDEATTPSLDALKLLSQANRLTVQDDQRVQFLKEAIRLDDTFAFAYRTLGLTLYWRGGQADSTKKLLEKAYRLSDRLNERERLQTIGTYHHFATKNYDAAIAAFEEVLSAYPRDFIALDHLALLYHRKKNYSKCVEMSVRATQVTMGQPSWREGLCLVDQGRLRDADVFFANLMHHRGVVEKPVTAWQVTRMLADIERLQGKFDSAQAIFDRSAIEDTTTARSRATALGSLALFNLLRGNVSRFPIVRRQADYWWIKSGADSAVANLRLGLWLTSLDLEVFQDRKRAAARLASTLTNAPLTKIKPASRPYAWIASLQARLGNTAAAEANLAALEETGHLVHEEPGVDVPILRAMIAANKGEFEIARQQLQIADRLFMCPDCIEEYRAYMFEKAQQPDSVAAAWERYVLTPGTDLGSDAFLYPTALEWLAAYYDARRDTAKAARYYGMLLDVWKDPDPPLRARWQRARNRLTELTAAHN